MDPLAAISYIFLLALCAFVYSNVVEWFIHKHILHGLGKKPNNLFNFHWKRHHRLVRQYHFYDKDYDDHKSRFFNGKNKELIGLIILWMLHVPFIILSPVLFAVVTITTINYYRLHRKAHKYPTWGKNHLRHHYDHHMFGNQSHNWCVTHPFADYLFGTRVCFREQKDGSIVRVKPKWWKGEL